MPTHYDILIRNGRVLDGSGSEATSADVGILGDRVTGIGDLSHCTAAHEIDAAGRTVAPGFIDIHTHSDISATYDPHQASSVAMGVTTQVVGNCGVALGFATPSATFDFEKRWLAPHGARIRWDTFAGFLQQVTDTGIATNFIPLAGHGTLRKRVVGMEERVPGAAEMDAMKRDLAEAMEAGAWGLSSGLEYPPSAYATESELAELCEVVGQYGGFYATHLRNEGDTLVEAVQEALNVVTRAGIPLQLSHHKAEGRANWGKVETTLAMVDEARASGLDVQLDQYPYTAFMTGLAIQTLPRWALSGTMEETAARFGDPVQRARIAAEMESAHPDWATLSPESPWHNIQIGVSRGQPELQGQTIAALAKARSRDPISLVLDLLASTEGFLSAVNFAICEEDIAQIMRYPWTSIGSDGVGTHPGGVGGKDQIHPRAYGTFPRVLGRYVRDLGILTEAEAVHKMTGLPAARMGLTSRGRLAVGCFADVTIYDPKTIADCATFDDPHQLAVGIDTVIVNGRIALGDGAGADTLAGRVLRRDERGRTI